MPTDKKWARVRAEVRINRKSYTDVLKAHGVEGRGYMLCTDAVYRELLGARAWQLRADNDLEAKANLRDHLDAVTLGLILVVEAIAAERIEDEMCLGNSACIEVSAFCARTIVSGVARARGYGRKAA